jgi:hypothetical protein
MSQNGKGDTPRPLSVDMETYTNNWERIFGRKDGCEYSGLPSVGAYEPPTVDEIKADLDNLERKIKEQLIRELQEDMSESNNAV